MLAMTFIGPQQGSQVSISTSNTRFKRCTQVIAAWRNADGESALAACCRPRRGHLTVRTRPPWLRDPVYHRYRAVNAAIRVSKAYLAEASGHDGRS